MTEQVAKVRRREVLPEDTVVDLGIRKCEFGKGQHGPEAAIDYVVLTGPHRGHKIRDWCSMERVDGAYIAEEGTKMWEVLLGAYNNDEDAAAAFTDPASLRGKKVNARLRVAGKQGKRRNALEYGSIGPVADGSTEAATPPANEPEPPKAAEDLNDEDFDDIPFD